MTCLRNVALLLCLCRVNACPPAFAQVGPSDLIETGTQLLQQFATPRAFDDSPPMHRRLPAPSSHRAEVVEAQKLLGELGYSPGAPDGQMGPNTRKAIAAFQGQAGLRVTGALDAPLLAALREAMRSKTAPADQEGPNADAESEDARSSVKGGNAAARPNALASTNGNADRGAGPVPSTMVPWAPDCPLLLLDRLSQPMEIAGTTSAGGAVCYAIKPNAGTDIRISLEAGPEVAFSVPDHVTKVREYAFKASGYGYFIKVSKNSSSAGVEPFRLTVAGGQSADAKGPTRRMTRSSSMPGSSRTRRLSRRR